MFITRSQADARIADCTASQHLWGSRDVIGDVTIGHFLLVVLWNQASYLQRFPRYSTVNITQWLTWFWYDLWTKVKVIHFGTNGFLIHDFL